MLKAQGPSVRGTIATWRAGLGGENDMGPSGDMTLRSCSLNSGSLSFQSLPVVHNGLELCGTYEPTVQNTQALTSDFSHDTSSRDSQSSVTMFTMLRNLIDDDPNISKLVDHGMHCGDQDKTSRMHIRNFMDSPKPRDSERISSSASDDSD